MDFDKYVKYKNRDVKIGFIENLYYISFQKYEKAYKEGMLSPFDRTISPDAYIRPNIGFRFRFPFPDEDKLPFGEIGNFPRDRGVPVIISPEKDHNINIRFKNIIGKDSMLEIIQQKLVHRMNDGKLCLALIVRNPDSGLYSVERDDPTIRKMVQNIISNHVVNSTNTEERNFYRTIALRIRDGLRLELSNKNAWQQSAGKVPRLRRRGR